MAPITAARSTLADGCTTMTNATSASAGQHDGQPRARTVAAVNSTAPQTMVTLAPDTAVRWVSPADTELLGGLRGHRRRVAQHQRGQHRRLIGGQRRRVRRRRSRRGCHARPGRSAPPRPVSAHPSPTAPRRSGRAALAGRCGRGKLAGRPAVSSANSTARVKTTTRPDISLPPTALQRPAEHHPAATQRARGSRSA